TTPIVLGISNAGSSGIRNLYVEMDVTGPSDVAITDKEPWPPRALWFDAVASLTSSWSYNYDELLAGSKRKSLDVDWPKSPDLREGFAKTDTGWRLTFEWAALQPRRQRLVVPALFVTARTNGTVRFVAKVFADSLPDPVSLESTLELAVMKRKV